MRRKLIPKSCANLRIVGDAGGGNPALLATDSSKSPSSSSTASSSSSSGSGSGDLAALAAFFFGAAAFGASDFGTAGAPPPPPAASCNDKIGAPTLILSPALTEIFVTFPAAGLGIPATAFPVSTSMIVWPALIVSPSFTEILTTEPESAPSPKFGSLTSIKKTRKLGSNSSPCKARNVKKVSPPYNPVFSPSH